MGWKTAGLIAAAGLAACVSAPPREAGASGGRGPVDAFLPTGRALFAFDFARARYQKAPLSGGPSDSLAECRLLDTLRAGFPDPGRWLALAAPNRPFDPMQAAWGPNGNFFLLDRTGRRLGLYDTNAQFLSGFPLPAEIRGRNLDAFQVFWTRDGSFTFLDLGEGVARRYAEIRASGGQGDWRLRNTVRLPVGTGACVWEPFLRDPCCLDSRGGAICFDAYFNPARPWPPPHPARAPGMRPFPGPGGREWIYVLDGGPGCAAPAACLAPGKGALPTCPADPDPGPAP